MDLKKIRVLNGDVFEYLKELPNNSIDCVITDPPYNVLALEWDNQEIDWAKLAKELFRVLKDFGSVYIFCQFPVGFRIFEKFNNHFEFKQDLIWNKNRGISLTKTVYMRKHENILYFIKNDKDKWIRFGEYIKEQRLKKNLSLKEIGELCGEKWYHRGGHLYYETGLGKPNEDQYNKLKEVLGLDDRFDKEFFNRGVFNKHSFNFDEIKLKGTPYRTHRKNQKIYGQKSKMVDYIQDNNGYRHPSSVLKHDVIQRGNREYIGHPTQKPVALIKYLIKSCTNQGDIILDCFVGSGSTLVACQGTGRFGIGIESNKEHVRMCHKRLSQKVLNF